MTMIEFLTDLNGIGELRARNGQFLGLLSSNLYDSRSIINPNTYSHPYRLDSIRNNRSIYGGMYGLYSPYNRHTLTPPVILYYNQPVLIVTKNIVVANDRLPVIDPDVLLGTYIQLASSGCLPQSNLQMPKTRIPMAPLSHSY